MRQCNELYRQLAALGRKFGAARIVLFGSRARGDNREHSDIDIAFMDFPNRHGQILRMQSTHSPLSFLLI